MTVCTFDNPKTMCRECWQEGRLLVSYSFEALHSARTIPPNDFFFGANVGPWKAGQLFGDPIAMQAKPAEESMANNRMWLRNKRTGQQVLLAQYTPSLGGWYCFHDNLPDRLDTLFKESNDVLTTFGHNDWAIEYDHEGLSVEEHRAAATAIM